MSSISDEHVEWAIVDRIRLMAEESHPRFEVTQAFSLLNAVLCWTIQRIRNGGSTDSDRLAATVLTALDREKISEAPWNIKSSVTNFLIEETSARELLIHIRNCTAHGDARNIVPIHNDRVQGGLLVGLKFSFKKKECTLLHEDMRRLTIEIASRFCNALRPKSNKNFCLEASQVKERTAL